MYNFSNISYDIIFFSSYFNVVMLNAGFITNTTIWIVYRKDLPGFVFGFELNLLFNFYY